MITQFAYRDNGGGEVLLNQREQCLNDALVSLMKYEYAYGGVPTKITSTEVEVKTQVLDCKDRTVFTGSEEDLAPLVEVSAWVAMTCTQEVQKALAEALSEKVFQATRGNPFLVSASYGMFIGPARLRTAVLIWSEGPDGLTPEVVKAAQRLSLEDLITVVTWAKEYRQGFLDTFDQLGYR